MKKPFTYLYEGIQGKIMTGHIRKEGSEYYKQRLSSYSGRPILNMAETNRLIAESIQSGKPFMVCRFGSTELATIKTFDFEGR